MNYIGLDLSFTGTGLVVLNEGGFIVYQELVSTSSKELIECRIIDINEKLLFSIKEFEPSSICIEGLSMQSKGQSTLDLAGLHFYVRTSLFKSNQFFCIVSPTTLKKFVTGTGRCQKNLMLLKCYKKFGIEFDNDNLCDAYCLAQYSKYDYSKK